MTNRELLSAPASLLNGVDRQRRFVSRYKGRHLRQRHMGKRNDGGEGHSSEAVRHRIRDLVEGERANAVLSDDRIVEILKTDGIDIARRTVAKYREALRIPSSVERRRNKIAA